MQQKPPPLLPIFRSRLQAELLAQLLGVPDRRFTVGELARIGTSDVSAVSRELSRLVQAGLLREERVGRTRVLQADRSSPYFTDLANLVTKAFGPGRMAAETLGEIPGVSSVVVFGSWAARAAGEPGAAPRDLDVLVVGRPRRVDVHHAVEGLEVQLGLPVHLTFASPQEWVDGSVGVISEIRRRPFQEFTGEQPG